VLFPNEREKQMSVTVNIELDEILGRAAASAPFERLLAAHGRTVTASGAAAGHPFAVAVLAHALDAPVLALAPDPRSAEVLTGGVAAFLGPDRVTRFPAWESLPYEGISPAPAIAGNRARAASLLRHARGAFVAVAPVLAALQGLNPELGAAEPLRLAAGSTLSGEGMAGDGLAERLAGLGYERVDVVEHRGEFAVRGGIVDLFPATARRPIRIDLFGDEIESLREFSPTTQLSTGHLGAVEVHQCRELVLSAETRALADAALPRYRGQYAAVLDRIRSGMAFEGMEQAIPLIHDRLPFLADLLPSDGWVVLSPARRVADRASHIVEEADALAEASGWPGRRAIYGLDEAAGSRRRLNLSEFAEPDLPDLGLRPWEQPTRLDTLAGRLAGMRRAGATVMVAAEGRGSLERALEVLGPLGLAPADVVAVEAEVSEGFLFDPGEGGPGDPGEGGPGGGGPEALAVVTEEDLFGRRRHTRTAPRLTARQSQAVAVELSPGDLCVHEVHGVGRYVGMVRRAVAGAERDYLLLEYAAGDRLYVPSDQVGAVAKYVGGEAPRLHRLGTGDWVKAKGRVRRAVRDMAGDLLRLYSVRMSNPGHAFGPDSPWQAELEDAFPHEETRDQLAAIEDVKRDMESTRPMDRLICGDVGYGKTEIAVRAAFKAVMDGKQVAVLVPTTLLAEQHYVTFSERYAPFPVTVRMLSRFVPPREQAATLKEVAEGKVDVLIGTHRLLSGDVKFKDLGLLVVDEEQRFGVAHKERLKTLRASVDVLTMTATPIPRTLEMSLAGIRDMSVVDTPPEDRQPVLTYVGPWDEEMALAAVRRELLRGGQVFWVHNRVETIERRARALRERLGEEARVTVAHGQMDEERLEKVMMQFWDRTADVLVCTTIIESGLDVPSANTLVVERADRLGLAQLYQLRGRVGRSSERAFAYSFFPPQSALSDEAHERLAAISRFTALGSGMAIAMRDLEIRGAGNLLGAEQSGQIAAVGFDTYVKLLSEALTEMKGEPVQPEREVRIDLPVKAFIPPEWVGQEALRLELYRRIGTARDPGELAAVRAEAEDRFGELPASVRVLFEVGELRLACLALGVEEVSTVRGEVRIRPLPEAVGLALAGREEQTFHPATGTLNLAYPPNLGGEALTKWVRDSISDPPVPAEVA
jgi:transcription-repair coupling factor (superfamily II helicase)